MSRLTHKKLILNDDEFIEVSKEEYCELSRNIPDYKTIYNKLGKIEDLLEKYEIEDLIDLEIALDYYNHRFDSVHTERVDKEWVKLIKL